MKKVINSFILFKKWRKIFKSISYKVLKIYELGQYSN